MLLIADLNKDNQLDIIVANPGSNDVNIFFGYGNVSFGTPQIYSTGSSSSPYGISVADFNNDHWLDLAVGNYNTENLGVLLGIGQGYLGSQATYPTGSKSQPYSIAVGDFNKDNRLDVAVVAYGTNNIAILLGHPTEDSTNQTVDAIETNSPLSSVIVTNVNNANWIPNDVPILLGDYYADFLNQTAYSTGSSSDPYSIASGNLNNDTKIDLVVANSGNQNLGLIFGYGNGSFAPETIYSTGISSSPRHVLIDDFNNDNQSDVAVTNPRDDNIIVLLGDGSGTFPTETTYSTGSGSSPSTLAIGNFNNDNYLDLVVTNTQTDAIGIFFGFDYTLFASQNPCDSGADSEPESVAVGDFNNDGHLDITAALYNQNNVGVFLGYGNGTFMPMMTYSEVPLSHPWSVAVGDFNNDKHLDITAANWGSDDVSVVLGYGDGTFTAPALYSTGSGSHPASIAVGHFNDDNYLDITAANYGGNSIAVFLGYGDGTFRNVIIFSTGKGSVPASVTVSDINNDSHLDIIVANEGSNNVGVFLGYGNGSFAEQMTFSTGDDSSPEYAIAGDFNKDGWLDLATANLGVSNVGILYGYGNGTFGNLQTFTTGVGSNPINLMVADFNNDSQLDILFGDENSDNLGIFFGYGDGTFASMSPVPIDQGSIAYAVAVGDFNNDNRLDLTYADYGYNNIRVFLAYGSKPFGGQTTFLIDEGSRPSSAAVAHFTNDRELDIAIANYGTNSIGILLGYGNRMFADVLTYSTGNDSRPMSIATGDFNNDSLTDIVVANSQTNNVGVLLGYGNGSFSPLTTYSMGDESQPVSVAVGDFNRDYQLDLAVANFGKNNVCILFGFGDGTFNSQTCYPLGYNSRPNWILFKDVNNDGWKDIAVATFGIDNIKILLNLC